MLDYLIPLSIQGVLQGRANVFIRKMLPKVSWRIVADCRGKYVYIRRAMPDWTYHNLGRMTYTGDSENMPFAIYRYSTEKYDEKADFAGSQYLNGTIEGAIQAVLAAYP